MAASKLLDIVSGQLTQRAASQTSAGAGDAGKVVALTDDGYLSETMFPLGEVVDESAGVGDAGKVVKLGADGLIDDSMMPVGFGADTASILTSENLSAGDLVNVYSDGGVAKCRKADATSAGKEANGYVLASTTSGQNASVYFEQRITGLSGLTDGSIYYLSTTAGGYTTTEPSSSGNVVQRIGRAVSDSVLLFMPGDPVTLA